MAGLLQNLFGRWTRGSVPFRSSGASSFWLHPDCSIDQDNVIREGLWTNGIVAIGLDWFARNWGQAKMVVVEVDGDGVETSVGRHPLLGLLNQPHPGVSGHVLISSLIRDVYCNGSCFMEKVKNGLGEVVELRRWDPRDVSPIYPVDGSSYLLGWSYSANGEPVSVPLDRVIHIRRWTDPHNDRKGWSPLKSLSREISVLNETSVYTSSLLKNYAVPGLILTPKGEWSTDDIDAKAVKDKVNDALTGANRGSTTVLTGAYEIQKAGFSPEEIGLSKIPMSSASQVLSAMGLNLTALGLDVGGNGSQVAGTSFAESVRSAWVHGLMPLQMAVAIDLTHQLLVDFEDPERVKHGELKVTLDWSQVSELEDREQVIANRAIRLYQAGTHTLNESREMTGYGPSGSPDADMVGLERTKLQMAAGVGQPGPLGPNSASGGVSEGDSLGGVRTDRKPGKGKPSGRTGGGGKGSAGGGVSANAGERRSGAQERSSGAYGRSTARGDSNSPSRSKGFDTE